MIRYPDFNWLVNWYTKNSWPFGYPGYTANSFKRWIIDDAMTYWVERGRPKETLNEKMYTVLLYGWQLENPGVVRAVSAGQPGAFYPTTAPIPSAVELQSMPLVINPRTPWPVGDYVVTSDGKHMTWTGFAWLEVAPVMDYAALVLADGATHHWPLSEASGATAADAIGSLNGTVVGTVLYGQPGVVAPSTCMVFPTDGSALITLPSFPSLAGAFTLETWVRLRSNTGSTAGIIMRAILSGGDFQYSVGSDARLTFLFIGDTYQTWLATNPLALNTWVYLVAVGGAGQFTMYLNGAVVAPGSMAMQIAYNGAGGVALAGSTEAAYGWRGDIQDIAMYPLALTPAQIAAHYAARVP